MNFKTLREAFNLLIPRRVGTANGAYSYTKPNIRAALIVLVANGRTCIINASLHLPDGAIIDARNPKGTILVGCMIRKTPATHPLNDFSLEA